MVPGIGGDGITCNAGKAEKGGIGILSKCDNSGCPVQQRFMQQFNPCGNSHEVAEVFSMAKVFGSAASGAR